jgi:hypothetical protein
MINDCHYTKASYVKDFLVVHTSKFFSWTNTLGAEMTAIVVSLLLLASSCFAKAVAVSWEYCPHSVSSFEV